MPSSKFYIIGIGPGSKDYLTPSARRVIQNSDCLVGAKRIISLFNYLKKEKVYLEGNFDKVIEYIRENINKKKIAVLVSGDPGLYSFLGRIKRHFKKEYYEIIPGISSLQLAFARIGEIWQDARVISLHGRGPGNLVNAVKSCGKVFLFTDSRFSPEVIARYLLNHRIEDRRAIVFENLSYPDERIIDTNLKSLSKMDGFGLCAMIIKK